MKLSVEEVHAKSTPEERHAEWLFNRMKSMEWMTEAEMLEYGQVVSIIVARNKRLGLIK